jgi:hypothetical protein
MANTMPYHQRPTRPSVPIALVKTPSWYRRVRDIIDEAEKKGLEVHKCSFQPGWSITLPSGSILYVDNVPQLADYIKGY